MEINTQPAATAEPKGYASPSKQYSVEDVDPYGAISSSDYVPDYLGIERLGPVTIICG